MISVRLGERLASRIKEVDWLDQKSSKLIHGLRGSLKHALSVAPFLIMFLSVGFLSNPNTRAATLWMLRENHPIELLTFVAAFGAGIIGLVLAWRAKKYGESALVFGFYALFALVLIVVGLEEIAWGQQFVGFETPAAWSSINLQDETTLHNVAGIQGHSEVFRLVFGLAGLVGVRLSTYQYFQKIASPVSLLPWFVVITLHAGFDVFNDYVALGGQIDFYMQRTSELVELLIAAAALLYVALNSNLLGGGWKCKEPQTY